MLKANERDIRSYGITIYRIFGKKKDLEGLEEQLENQTILIDFSEQNHKSFISFKSIESVDTGILTEVWSHKDFAEIKHYYDGIQAGYSLITLKRGDIIELICTHRILTYFKVFANGLQKITIDQSMIKKGS
jgi:hypothetical protein